jgi:L-alanine-DL-glutamate epimerase-like enolase superfamily enzyme
MKITNVESYPVWGGERNSHFVVVDSDEAGAIGYYFKPLLIGKDPARTEHAWQTLFRGGFFPARPGLGV